METVKGEVVGRKTVIVVRELKGLGETVSEKAPGRPAVRGGAGSEPVSLLYSASVPPGQPERVQPEEEAGMVRSGGSARSEPETAARLGKAMVWEASPERERSKIGRASCRER